MRATLVCAACALFLGLAGFSRQEATFEVASVKAAGPLDHGVPKRGIKIAPALFSAHSVTLATLIRRSYDIEGYQLSGGPGWIDSELFDVEAKTEHPATPAEILGM